MITTCLCQHCNAAIEFDPTEAGISGSTASFGKTITCPSCNRPTPLLVPKGQENKNAKSSVAPLIIIGIASVVAAVVAILFGLGSLILLPVMVLGFVFYFLPAIVGYKKRNFAAIFVLNLLLGWTFLGWVVALVWAFTKDKSA